MVSLIVKDVTVGAACRATEPFCTFRCEPPDENCKVFEHEPILTDWLMVPPIQQTEKPVERGRFESPRLRFKTWVFTQNANSGFENLPDIQEGDILLWHELYTGEPKRKWFLVCGALPWLRPNNGDFGGCSYMRLILEDMCIEDDCWLPTAFLDEGDEL